MRQDVNLEYFIGKLDPPYESKEEAQIGHMLEQYQIPFFYKQATLVKDQGHRKVTHVDFNLPTRNGMVIDYIVAPDTRDYQEKKALYEQNQMPALLVTNESLKEPNWQQKLYDKVQELYHRPVNDRYHL